MIRAHVWEKFIFCSCNNGVRMNVAGGSLLPLIHALTANWWDHCHIQYQLSKAALRRLPFSKPKRNTKTYREEREAQDGLGHICPLGCSHPTVSFYKGG